MIFEDFELTITAPEPPPGGSNVTVRYAKGMRTGVFSFSSVAAAVDSLNVAMLATQPAQAILETGGSALFNACFSGRVGDAWRESLTLARERQRGVRLRLYSELPAIIAVPWEYLYDPIQGRWLALDSALSLVRALPLTTNEPIPIEGTLRVLVMLATPSDLPILEAGREWANLETATLTAAIDLIRVEPTYEALQGALRQYSPHIFHFVGHGVFPASSQETIADGTRNLRPVETLNDEQLRSQGTLAFCRADGTADLVPADKLAILLASCKTLRLVLLNACQGAVTGTRSAFAGVAQQLLQQETPAVIAMQAPIYDNDALRFSQEFYRALADGLSVEQAVGEGRKRINETACTWGIPTCYLQGAEPFAIMALTAAQKAARLWQKVLDKMAGHENIDQVRSLLNQILSLDPSHSGARNRLQQLDNEVEAGRLYTEGVTHQAQQHWREAHRALEQVERLCPNYRDTRSRLAEVLGKLDQRSTLAAPDERRRQLQPILNALLEGRFVPFLGWDAARFGRPLHDRWLKGQYAPDTAELASELAARLGIPAEGPLSLLHISELTTLLEDEVALYERLYDLVVANYPPTLLHRLLAELTSRLCAKGYPKRPDWRLVIFSTAFDDSLERAFVMVGQPYHLFAYHHRALDADGVVQPGRFVHLPPANGPTNTPIELLTPNDYHGHDGDRYPVIVKLCGLHITRDPNSVVVTEGQYLEYLPGQDIGALLPPTLLDQVRKRTFVFFGCTSQEWHFRLLWQRMRYQKSRLHAKGWAILPQPSEIEMKFWGRLDREIEPLALAPEMVVATINDWLDALAPA